jgi:hypothetical protein
MKRVVVYLVSVWAALAPSPPAAPAASPPEPTRYGQVFVLGNESTSVGFILERFGLYPGMVISGSDIEAAERRLAASRLFRPGRQGRYICLESNPADPRSPYKDVVIQVEEQPWTPLVWAAAEWAGIRHAWLLHCYGVTTWATEALVVWVGAGLDATCGNPQKRRPKGR